MITLNKYLDKHLMNTPSKTTLRKIVHIEVSGRATLYAGYENSLYEDIKDALSTMTPEEREEFNYEKLSQISEPDDFLVDEYDGYSFDNHDLYVKVVFEDGEEKEYSDITLEEENGKTEQPEIAPIRRSYTKRIDAVYLDDEEPIEIKGDFDISKLHFVLNHYTVNGKEFTTCAELRYDGIQILPYEYPEGGDEKWAEIQFQYEGENYCV